MKLQRLRAENFLGLKEIDIEFDRLTMITGRNGAGKSSVRDAVAYALTGRARSTDAAGRGADRLVRAGSSGMRVKLETTREDGHACEWSRGTGSTGPKHHDADMMEACLDAPYLLQVDSKTRSGILSRLICPPLTVPEVAALAAREGASKAVCAALAAGLAKDGPEIGPAQLEANYRRAYERRTETKRDLTAARERLKAATDATGEPPTPEDLAAAKATLASLEARHTAASLDAGALKARAEELSRLVAEQAEINAALEAIVPGSPSAGLDFGPGASPAELEIVTRKWLTAVTSEEANVKGASANAAASAKALAEAQAEIKVVQGWTDACPSIHQPASCPLSAANLEARRTARLNGLADVVKKAETKAKKDTNAAETAGKLLANARKMLEAAQTAQREAETKAAEARGSGAGQTAGLVSRREAIEKRLDAIGDVDGAAEAARVEAEGLEFTLSVERDHVADLDRAFNAAANRAADEKVAKDLASRVELLEAIVGLLDPKGLPAKIVESQAGPFEAAVNGAVGTLTELQFHIGIEAGSKGVELLVYKAEAPDWPMPVENLSKSERLRLGVALAAAICALRGLPLVIDEADMLDSAGKRSLALVLRDLPPAIESVVVLATADAPGMPSGPGRAAYWIEDGTAVRIEAPAGVAA